MVIKQRKLYLFKYLSFIFLQFLESKQSVRHGANCIEKYPTDVVVIAGSVTAPDAAPFGVTTCFLEQVFYNQIL